MPQGVDGRAAVLAVQRGGEDLRHRRLAGAARAHEQVRVVDAILRDRVAERADHMLLAHDVCERAGAMTAVQRSGQGTSESRGATSGLGVRAAALNPARCGPLVAADPSRLPQLRHRLLPDLGRGRGARPPARLRRLARADAAPAGDRARDRAVAVRRRRPDALGCDRLPVAGRGGVAVLRARRALVRARGGGRGGADHPHPHPRAVVRGARLRRHPVCRAGAGRAARGGSRAAARRAPAGAAGPRRAAAARRRGCSRSPTSPTCGEPRLLLLALVGAGAVGAARRDPGRRPAALADRHARPRASSSSA